MTRPARLVMVLGTGTEVGKTWVACQLLDRLQVSGMRVAARKPAQSFAGEDLEAGVPTDADQLAGATGEEPHAVCPPHRWYPVAVAPPMAADRLGLPPIALATLVAELDWPEGVDVGLVEAAGGSRSPIAHDGDGVALALAVAADSVVLVADAGLGTIHSVRAAIETLGALPVVVVLNRFDEADPLHLANRAWLMDRDGLDVVTTSEALAGHPSIVGPPSGLAELREQDRP